MSIALLKPSKLSIAALEIMLQLKDIIKDDGTHTDPSIIKIQKSVKGIAVGADYNGSLIFYVFDQAAKKMRVSNPLIASPYPFTQYSYCVQHAYFPKTRIYDAKGKLFTIIQGEKLNAQLLRQGDIFLYQTREGLWHCGLIYRILNSRVVTLEASRTGVDSVHRSYNQLQIIIRVN